MSASPNIAVTIINDTISIEDTSIYDVATVEEKTDLLTRDLVMVKFGDDIEDTANHITPTTQMGDSPLFTPDIETFEEQQDNVYQARITLVFQGAPSTGATYTFDRFFLLDFTNTVAVVRKAFEQISTGCSCEVDDLECSTRLRTILEGARCAAKFGQWSNSQRIILSLTETIADPCKIC